MNPKDFPIIASGIGGSLFRQFIARHGLRILLGSLVIIGLGIISVYNYLLFHTLSEGFSIVIVFALFLLAWNTRQLMTNHYVFFLSTAYLFASLLDLAHTLTYEGVGIIPGYGINLPAQLWLAARYLQALSLLVAPWFIDRRPPLATVLAAYLAVTVLLLATAFSGILPDAYVEGQGLTPFKIWSEYLICLILMAALILLLRRRHSFDRVILACMVSSIVLTIASELAFTAYLSPYDQANLIGHVFKIMAFYFLYRATVGAGLEAPYRHLFFDLERHREELQIIIDSSPILIFYKDQDNRLIRVNKTYASLAGLTPAAMEGRTVTELFPQDQALAFWEHDREVIRTGQPQIGIVKPLSTPRGLRWLSIDKIPYRDREGRIIGVIGFAEDITERKKATEALETERQALQKALDEVKVLSGIMPICSNCKKIRDDKGYWSQVEQYISEHSEAQFSHSICPDCMKLLYPDLADEVAAKEAHPPGEPDPSTTPPPGSDTVPH